MAVIKIGTLILYLFLAYVAIRQPLTLAANASLGLLVLLALAHLVECYLYRDLIRRAPGPAAWHLLSVFLFGVLHQRSMERALRAAQTDRDPGSG